MVLEQTEVKMDFSNSYSKKTPHLNFNKHSGYFLSELRDAKLEVVSN